MKYSIFNSDGSITLDKDLDKDIFIKKVVKKKKKKTIKQ